MTIPKPSPRAKEPRSKPMPKCECGHGMLRHVLVVTDIARRTGCEDCGIKTRKGSRFYPKCDMYRPRVSVRRSPIQRASAPIKRKAKVRAQVMPKCKHCSHPGGKHTLARGLKCVRCAACPGYQPAIGKNQKRRTPQAALRRLADGLWSQLIKRAGVCDLKTEHPHECKGPLEAMHMIPRTFSATRWLPINGVCGCSFIHLYYTRRPELWSAVCLMLWGEPTFRELWALARASQPVDMDAVVASLRAELARLEA